MVDTHRINHLQCWERCRSSRIFVQIWLLLLCCVLIQLQLQAASPVVDLSLLKSSEIALLQYDSRELRDYWLASAVWNHRYCQQHGHQYFFYATKEGCHYKQERLATPWCKVKAMIAATEDHPDVKFFIYMDSDAVIDKQFANVPVNKMLSVMQQRLSWNPSERPIVFNQDGPCWWCRLIKNVGYSVCLNAGTVAWYRHQRSYEVLTAWWESSMDAYEGNPIKRKFRLKWPWEQDRQMAVYNRSAAVIQVSSQPERAHMQTRAGLVTGWCLSHLPGSGCFISHYCANSYQKQVMRKLYSAEDAWMTLTTTADASVSNSSSSHSYIGSSSGGSGISNSGGSDTATATVAIQIEYLRFSESSAIDRS